jgi:S-adenosylmethionine uptake transporter
MKYVGQNIGGYQIIFFRFLFGTLVLLPFVWHQKLTITKSALCLHFTRGVLLFCGISLWIIGLGVVKLTIATSINFIIPVFILILATIFLNEKFSRIKAVATLVGFIGTILVINPIGEDFNIYSVTLIVGAFIFAILDIVNKHFIIQESTLNMLFYSGLFVFLFSIIPAMYNWSKPTINDLFFLFLLGIGGNLILYCLLKSFALINISSVASYRYTELIFSGLLGYIIFDEIPNFTIVIGSLIIALSTLFLMYETLRNKVV